MRLNKEELINKISEYEISDDIKVGLLEDITDSIDNSPVVEELQKTIDDLSSKLSDTEKERDEISNKYIDRFKINDSIRIVNDKPLDDVKEKDYIDIKSI